MGQIGNCGNNYVANHCSSIRVIMAETRSVRMSKSVYEKRIVAFVDILGFKNHIEKSTKDSDHAKLLLKVMNNITEIKTDNDHGSFALKPLGKEVTIFSDCIVISYPFDYEGGLFHILIDLIHIQLNLFFKGILLRGGISVGKVYHSDSVVFGPAMVEAYELESTTAIFPRIVIRKDSLIKGIEKTKPDRHTVKMEVEYIKGLIRVDENDNELFYLDILNQAQEFDEPFEYVEMLYEIRKIIISSLSSLKKGSVKDKYKWLRDYFNTIVKEYVKWLEDNGFEDLTIGKNDY